MHTFIIPNCFSDLKSLRLRASFSVHSCGIGGGISGIGLTHPFDGQSASVGNGVMVALEAGSPEQVGRLHALALAHGGSCEGAPGPRGEGFYAGYFRDPDGNKLNAFCMSAPEG